MKNRLDYSTSLHFAKNDFYKSGVTHSMRKPTNLMLVLMQIFHISKKSILLLTARERAYFYDYIILHEVSFCNIFGSVKVYFFWNKGIRYV